MKVLHTQDGGHVVPVSYMFYFRTFVPENVWYGFDYCHSNGAFMPHAADFSRKDYWKCIYIDRLMYQSN